MFMIEKALVGGRRYWTWTLGLLAVVVVGLLCYFRQLSYGLGITGMSRNITWGLYIGQFTFLVGIAASAVMIVLPYYLHNHKEFARMALLGEFLAISAVSMCALFILVDLGQPSRVLYILLYPTPSSIIFWDVVALGGYLVLNALIALVTLGAEGKGIAPPAWIKPIILLSIPWAISIHTVTAFLYAGLPGRSFWLTAVLAPRFLASAFASGPALLILLCMLLRKLTGYDLGSRAISTLAVIVAYAMIVNVFFLLMELFTSFYSQIPSLVEHFQIMYTGMQGPASLLLFLGRLSLVLMAIALLLLLIPGARRNERMLVVACVVTFLSLWIDKGVCLVVCGFVPSPLGAMTRYVPTLPEVLISVGVWAVGALMITVFYKIALSVRQRPLGSPVEHETTPLPAAK
jgi:molybdopterin-containing oxidoreductase family membrane subunit